jgi:hypothetical protein
MRNVMFVNKVGQSLSNKAGGGYLPWLQCAYPTEVS